MIVFWLWHGVFNPLNPPANNPWFKFSKEELGASDIYDPNAIPLWSERLDATEIVDLLVWLPLNGLVADTVVSSKTPLIQTP